MSQKQNGLDSAATDDQALTPERPSKEAAASVDNFTRLGPKGGEMTNAEFMKSVFGSIAADEYLWTASFTAKPSEADGKQWGGKRVYLDTIEETPYGNSYFCVAVLKQVQNGRKQTRDKDHFARLACVVLDDIKNIDLAPTWRIETSDEGS